MLWILRLTPGYLKWHLQSVSRESAALESELQSLSHGCCGSVSLHGPGPYGIMSSSSEKTQPCPQRQEKCEGYMSVDVLKGRKNVKAFLSFTVLSQLAIFLFVIYNCCKKNLKISMISMDFTIHLHIVHAVLTTNIRAFNLYAESLK